MENDSVFPETSVDPAQFIVKMAMLGASTQGNTPSANNQEGAAKREQTKTCDKRE